MSAFPLPSTISAIANLPPRDDSVWHRVFGLSATPVSPVALVEHLTAKLLVVVPHFRGDDLGWTSGELHLPGNGTPLLLERYLTEEDELRKDLNAFAAELETMNYSPNFAAMMERVIQTKQMITLRKPYDHADEVNLDATVLAICRYFAANCEGVYQIDGQGWFAADGTVIVQEY